MDKEWRELREQGNRNSAFFCKRLKDYVNSGGYINTEWDVAYPLIDVSEANQSVLLNDERFWGKR